MFKDDVKKKYYVVEYFFVWKKREEKKITNKRNPNYNTDDWFMKRIWLMMEKKGPQNIKIVS